MIKTISKGLFIAIWYLMILSLVPGCTQNDDQQEFERDAFSLAGNFTETLDNGEIVEGKEDPDDWRVSPFYQGTIEIYPPYPNPVLSTERLIMELLVRGIDALNGFRIYILYNESNYVQIPPEFNSPIPPGLTTVTLDARSIARFEENPEGLYRLIIEDLRGNVISYGDVKIN
jgi:hypothetical protein